MSRDGGPSASTARPCVFARRSCSRTRTATRSPKIQERKLSVRDKIAIERGGESLATVRKALVGLRDRFSIDVARGGELHAKGNIVDHEYEIDRDGQAVATVSKRWFRVRDTYGVEIAPGEDDALVLAIAVCVDALSHRGN